MLELLPTLIPILAIDLLSPVLLGLMIVAAGTTKPVRASLAVLAGYSGTYFLFGIAVAYGIHQVTGFLVDWFNHPTPLDFVVSACIGIFCLYQAFRPPQRKSARQEGPESYLSPAKYFMYGSVANVVSIPFAVPYFAAVDQIIRADLSATQSLAVLAGYNIGYALPFFAVPVIVAIMGKDAGPVLTKVNSILLAIITGIMPWLLGLLGLWLLIDAVYYFYAGEPMYYI